MHRPYATDKEPAYRNDGLFDALRPACCEPFYSLPNLSDQADHLKCRQGGFLTLKDLEDHRPEWVEPLSVDFHGYQVWELPPAGQGIAALEMLRILDPIDLESMGHNSAEYLHHIVEAKKLAFADLARYISDRDYLEGDPSAHLADDYIAQRRALIDPTQAADRARHFGIHI